MVAHPKAIEKAFTEFEELYKRFRPVEGSVLTSGFAFVIGGVPKSIGLETGEDLAAFQAFAHRLRGLDPELAPTISTDWFHDRLVGLVMLHQRPDGAAAKDIVEILTSGAALPVETWAVYRPVYEAYLSEGPLELGPLTIEPWNEKEAVAKYPRLAKSNRKLWQSNPEVVARVEVNAREHERALELADELFRPADDILRFTQDARGQMAPATLFHDEAKNLTEAVLVSPTRDERNIQHKRFKVGAHVTKGRVADPARGHDWLWSLIGKHPQSKLEEKVMTAVRWAAQAEHDPDPSRAIVMYTFAFEALLQQRSGFVTPSITAHISEMLAFLIVEPTLDVDARREARLNVESEFQGIYKNRSGVAHGGETMLDWDQVEKPRDMLHRLITRIAKDPDMRTMSDTDKLVAWVKAKKYAA